MIVRMRVISYDVGDDDPFKKGPARYTRRRICERSSSIRSVIPLGQEIQTRQELLSPDLNAGWRQMGQP